VGFLFYGNYVSEAGILLRAPLDLRPPSPYSRLRKGNSDVTLFVEPIKSMQSVVYSQICLRPLPLNFWGETLEQDAP
jgi:hypothetical protein